MLRSMKSVFVRDVILLCVAAAMLLVSLVPLAAHAQYSKMGLFARHVVAASPLNIYTYSGYAGQSNNEAPKAFLVWSVSGDEFYVRRNTTSLSVFETHSIKVPADEEAVITPLQAYRTSDTPFFSFEFVGTVGDTLCIVPLWK